MEWCELCCGELRFLGILGNLIWWRCRDCGYEQCDVGSGEPPNE